MHMIHGLWIPADTDAFTQEGAFYLWVETDAPVGTGRKRAEAVHPRHLAQAALAAFLVEKLGVREFLPGTLVRTLTVQHVLLPTAEGAPLPSFELLRYVDRGDARRMDACTLAGVVLPRSRPHRHAQ